ncbi:MAG TPA: hypothetical protein VMS25_06135 [Candidatus Limnocylindrales bacterium]|nr:hypothetical protein [Candidatus Limnocylindrales bacterium]
MKIKALKNWPPQEWRSEAQTLAPENALDAADVSASGKPSPACLFYPSPIMTIRYGASLSLLAQLATKVALIISGVSPNKPLREIGELEMDSELSQ